WGRVGVGAVRGSTELRPPTLPSPTGGGSCLMWTAFPRGGGLGWGQPTRQPPPRRATFTPRRQVRGRRPHPALPPGGGSVAHRNAIAPTGDLRALQVFEQVGSFPVCYHGWPVVAAVLRDRGSALLDLVVLDGQEQLHELLAQALAQDLVR